MIVHGKIAFASNSVDDPEVLSRALRRSLIASSLHVMAGLVPAIHVFLATLKQDVDGRDKHGHDALGEKCVHPAQRYQDSQKRRARSSRGV